MAAGLLAAASIGMVLLTWKGGNGSVVGGNRCGGGLLAMGMMGGAFPTWKGGNRSVVGVNG